MSEFYKIVLISMSINVFNILIIGVIGYAIKEKINSKFEKEKEKLKADLNVQSMAEQANMNEKREEYRLVIESIKGLFSGEGTRGIERFLVTYNSVLLWGSDSLIKKLTYFLHCYEEDSTDNDKLTYILSEIIIEMRKDLYFNKTKLTPKDIVFKSLSPNQI